MPVASASVDSGFAKPRFPCLPMCLWLLAEGAALIGCAFAGLSYWERDRMYELGFPDMVEVLGRSMSLQEAGQWGALAALAAGVLGFAATLQAAQERVGSLCSVCICCAVTALLVN